MAADKKCPSPTEKSSKNGKKPNLRGLHVKQTLRHVYVACGLSIVSGALFYFLNNQQRKNAYQEFYANYDPNESFLRMQEAGVLSSCQPEATPPETMKKKNCLFSLVT